MSRVLIVEDDPKIRANLLFQLREEGLAAEAVESAEGALGRLGSEGSALPELLLVDVRLPGLSGVELIRRLAGGGRLPPTVIISGEASMGETVEALRLGVHDFVEKPFTKERLLRSVANALEHSALRREVAELREELEASSEILGASPPIEELRQKISQAAPTHARVLILGESGTGKELVAEALHRGSPRQGGPFIRINCAAIPDTLVEAELFGHAPGAFTDAKGAKAGLFEEADGGTLFLDEIGDMEVRLQARLLRVLEDGRVRRIGEAKERQVDVRVLAATHADLDSAVQEGRFREDLYFRLAHLPLAVPPLRERGEDIALLLEHFLGHFQRRHKSRPRPLTEPALALLRAYPWPGNVRELKALCERLMIFGAGPIAAADLPSAVRHPSVTAAGDASQPAADPPLPLKEFRAQAEKAHIERVLEETGWNISAAARILGIQRSYLHQKLATLGTRRPGSGDP